MKNQLAAPLVLASLSLVAAAPPALAQIAPNVDVTITADNGYGLGFGPASNLTAYFGGVFNTTAGAIFNCGGGPEVYVITGANVADFLYVACWSDDAVTQGLLGQLSSGGGPKTYTGAGNWQVYATGMDFDGPGGPSVAEIDAQIAIANAMGGASGTTSVGWVGTAPTPGTEGVLVFGEDNTTAANGACANPFPLVCASSTGQPNAMDPDARWMWYQRPGSSCAFFDGNQREFLIFRLPLGDVFCPPAVAASETPRAGTPPNPASTFLPGVTSAPITGAVWDPLVSPALLAGAFPSATPVVDVVAVSTASANVPLPPSGTLLVGANPLVFTASPGMPFAIAIPANCKLVGLPLFAQGASVGLGTNPLIQVALANGLDLVIGAF